MDPIHLLGLAAGSLTTLSFIPQVAQTLRTRSAHDFSYAMLVCFLAGLILWFVYGVVRDDPAIIIANAVTAVLLLCILAVKIRSP
ncbi:SemiSWEET family sugar transporter [uncultured Methanofollis sp.]|uniref:SemiSWEET family sugar transporter n=1 Tax=uncultured Methanofollis sp. TaxID=262500 RepID=UPI00260AB72E|nr:SemiSWEET transporter [uncultured Methanofollis sp.]